MDALVSQICREAEEKLAAHIHTLSAELGEAKEEVSTAVVEGPRKALARLTQSE